MRILKYFTLAILLPLHLSGSIAATSTTDCQSVNVEPQSLPDSLRASRPAHVITACDTDGESAIQIVAMAFEGPPAGVLFVRNSNGELTPPITIGRPNSLEVRK